MTEHIDPIPDDLPTCQERLRALLERLHDLERQLEEFVRDDRGAAALLRVPEGRVPGAQAVVLRSAARAAAGSTRAATPLR